MENIEPPETLLKAFCSLSWVDVAILLYYKISCKGKKIYLLNILFNFRLLSYSSPGAIIQLRLTIPICSAKIGFAVKYVLMCAAMNFTISNTFLSGCIQFDGTLNGVLRVIDEKVQCFFQIYFILFP